MAHRPKILVVDDRPENLYAMEKVLEKAEADIVTAENGNDALVATLHNDFALAILDVQMPEMDGYELAEIFRGEDKTRYLPIIFLSAVHSDDFHIFKGYESGAVDFLTKPLEPQILLAKVRIFLQLDRQKAMIMERESRLEDALDRLRTIIDTIPGDIMVINGDYEITDASRGIFRRYKTQPWACPGISDKSGLTGRKCHEVRRNLSSPCPECPMPRAFETGQNSTWLSTPEEERMTGRAMKTYAAPIRDRAGNIRGAVECSMDITDLRETERMLRQAKTLAESASQAKSDFLANISHEIRTPLNAIVGMTRLLSESDLEPEQAAYAEAAFSSSETLFSMVNDILDFSKAEAGKLEPECGDFDLRDTVEKVTDMLGLKADERGVRIRLRIMPDVPFLLRGDEGRLRQILINLMGNGIKFSHQGEIALNITREAGSASQATLRFAVSDTGIGIPPDRMDRLFKPFSQTDNSVSRKYGGTGLGLAISKHLAEIMGGRIGAESEEGKGSTFWFTAVFQIANPNPETSTRKPETRNQKPETRNQKPNSRILLAEDNKLNQMVALAFLKKMGVRADVADNGGEAVRLLGEKHYDLVFMDIRMPETDGFEATRIIRDPASPVLDHHIPIVAMTAHVMDGDRERCLEAGMDDYVSKPIRPEEITQALEKHLGTKLAGKPPLPDPSGKMPDKRLRTSTIFDRQELMARIGEDEGLCKEFLDIFVNTMPEQIGMLKAALEKNDIKETHFRSHAIKGICGSISAHSLRDIASDIEMAAENNRTDRIPGLADELERGFEAFRELMAKNERGERGKGLRVKG